MSWTSPRPPPRPKPPTWSSGPAQADRSRGGLALSLLSRRLTANLLAGPPARSVLAVCERLLAIQAQDPMGARLAVRARTRGLTAADYERALNDREVVVSWLN